MPRRQNITKGMVLDAAFSVVRESGMSELTARKIASKLQCSTIPIYSQFRSMGKLEEEVLLAASSLLMEYTRKGYTPHPFLNMGIGMILFSRDNPNLFKALFSGNARAHEIVEDIRSSFKDELSKVEDFSKLPPEHLEEMMGMMLTFTIGLANMASSGLLTPPTEEHVIHMLDESGDAVINHTIRKALDMDSTAGAVWNEYRMLSEFKEKGNR